MVENINPIANRSLTDTHFLSILPFLVILLGSLSLGVPNSEAVGSNPSDVAYNPTNDTIYVTNLYSSSAPRSDYVSAINGTTNEVIQNITVGSGPSAVTNNPRNNMIYVANQNSHSISVINAGNDKVEKTLQIGFSPLVKSPFKHR